MHSKNQTLLWSHSRLNFRSRPGIFSSSHNNLFCELCDNIMEGRMKTRHVEKYLQCENYVSVWKKIDWALTNSKHVIHTIFPTKLHHMFDAFCVEFTNGNYSFLIDFSVCLFFRNFHHKKVRFFLQLTFSTLMTYFRIRAFYDSLKLFHFCGCK